MTQPAARESRQRARGASPTISSRLVSLAILKENWNQGQTYLDNFVPFVAECLRCADGPVTSGDVQKALRAEFSIRVPQAVVETLLHKSVRKGYARRENNAYAPCSDTLAEVEMMPARQQALLRAYEALVAEMRTFAKERFVRELSEAEAFAALDAYVSEFGAVTVLQGSTAELGPRAVPSPDLDYITHAFVEDLARTNPASFGCFETIVEGSMLASVVYLPDPDSTDRKFRNSTTIFLDTPFVLRALGFVGLEQEAPAVELLDLLLQGNATVACFEATVSEVRGVVLASVPPTGGGPAPGANEVARHFRKIGLRRADVQIRADSLERLLDALGVKVRSAPPYTLEWGVDEKGLENLMGERIRYAREGALRHDLDALAAIHQLRAGRRPRMLEEAGAIFLTTNASLVAASHDYFRTEESDHAWPHAMLDTSLATLVWLKQPHRAPDLPRKQILADCYAALHPDERMWNRWLAEIQRIADSGEYSDADLDIMRFSPDAQRALMDVTMGDEAAIDERTIPQVLASAEETITAPVRAELEAQRAALAIVEKEKLDAVARAAELKIAAEAAQRTFADERGRRHGRLRERAEHSANNLSRVVLCVLIVAFVISAAWTVLGFFVGALSTPMVIRVFLGACIVLAAVATALHFWHGWNAKDMAKKVEGRCADWLHGRSLRRLGEDEPYRTE